LQSRLSIARGSAAARLPKLIGALLAGISLGAVTAHAQDATWKAAPATNNWNAGGNWTPDSVPTGTANFGASNTTTLTFSTASTSIGTIRFDAGAPAYTFNILGNKNLDVTGTGIVNNSGNAPTFNLDTQLEAGAARLRFFNSSTAGNATILGSRSGGPEFFNTSTAGTSKIFVNLFGNAIFHDSSTAGNATIGAGGGLFNGAVFFQDSSKAGTATISANLDGAVSFANSSSADHATISTTISSGTLTFQDNATAANATINNAARTTFTGSSKAADATINNVGGPSDNPLLVFTVDATAGNATITTGDRAVTEFTGNSSGGQARFIVDTGGIFDISAMSPSGTTAGSIAGGGRFFLGSKTLIVGSNNLSTEVSGVIGDGGRFGGGCVLSLLLLLPRRGSRERVRDEQERQQRDGLKSAVPEE